jgi:RNA polymerase sigma-70 factor, ECF subfamily
MAINKIYTDEELIRLLRDQDSQAIPLIFQKYHPFLCASAYRIVQDKDLAKDIVQEAFIYFWSKGASLKVTDLLKAYLHRSVINRAFNYLAKTKRFERASVESLEEIIDHSKSEAHLETKDLEAALTLAINLLPPVCRTVFMLSRYDELSNAEIADYLEISVKAVEKHMTKALRRLREVVSHFYA